MNTATVVTRATRADPAGSAQLILLLIYQLKIGLEIEVECHWRVHNGGWTS